MEKTAFINTNPYQDTSNIVCILSEILKEYDYTITNKPEEATLALSVGGDGTFIDTAKLAMNADIIGINRGTLGYLTEVEDFIETSLEKYMNGNYSIQKRMMLSCDIFHDDTGILALNDVAITKRNSSVIDIEIMVDGRQITKYYADGIIISTPTGSTGYAFSCGAPLIDPASEMIIITPIAPHTIMNRSICISPDSEICVRIVDARNDVMGQMEVDGKKYDLNIGQPVFVKKAEHYIKFVKLNNDSFLDRIYKKMKLK